jgi:hypothetical protein
MKGDGDVLGPDPKVTSPAVAVPILAIVSHTQAVEIADDLEEADGTIPFSFDCYGDACAPETEDVG